MIDKKKLFEEFTNHLKGKDFSSHTIKAYLLDTQLYFQFCNISNLSFDLQEAIYRYLSTLGFQKKSPSTIERKRAALVEFSNFYRIYNDGKDFFNKKKIKSPKRGDYLPHYHKDDDISSIMSSIDRHDALEHRTYMIIVLLYGTGLRASELLELKPSNIDIQSRSIIVKGKGRKIRQVFMGQDVLKEYLEYYNRFKNLILHYDCLFFNKHNKPLTYNGLYYIFKSLEKKMYDTLHYTKKLSPHTFRHSFATSLLHNGADIRKIGELLGHSSLNTTQRYTHIDKNYLRESLLAFHPHGSPN